MSMFLFNVLSILYVWPVRHEGIGQSRDLTKRERERERISTEDKEQEQHWNLRINLKFARSLYKHMYSTST